MNAVHFLSVHFCAELGATSLALALALACRLAEAAQRHGSDVAATTGPPDARTSQERPGGSTPIRLGRS